MAQEWNQAGPDFEDSGGEPPRKTSVWPWVIGGCSIAILVFGGLAAVLAAVIVPAVRQVKQGQRRFTCQSNLRQIGLACHMWADDNKEKFPPDLKSLAPSYIEHNKKFGCPSARNSGGPAADPGDSDYAYLPDRDTSLPDDFVLAYDRHLDNHGGAGFNVLFCDVSVEWREASSLKAFNKLVDAQDAAVKAIRKNPEDRAKILKEYARKYGGAYGGPVPATTPAPAPPPPSGGRY